MVTTAYGNLSPAAASAREPSCMLAFIEREAFQSHHGSLPTTFGVHALQATPVGQARRKSDVGGPARSGKFLRTSRNEGREDDSNQSALLTAPVASRAPGLPQACKRRSADLSGNVAGRSRPGTLCFCVLFVLHTVSVDAAGHTSLPVPLIP